MTEMLYFILSIYLFIYFEKGNRNVHADFEQLIKIRKFHIDQPEYDKSTLYRRHKLLLV